MWQKFTEEARRAMFHAKDEAERLGDNCVSTKHLLLGLCKERASIAVQVLERMEVNVDRLVHETEKQAPGHDRDPESGLELTPRARNAVTLAYSEARRLNDNFIGV